MQTLRQGDAATAASEAEKGYKDFHAVGPEWAWKFTILRARILYQRSMNDEALKVFASEPAPLPPGELTIQKLRWQGLIYASMHRFPDAEQKLSDAEQLCAALVAPACAEIVHARGEMEMERGQYAQAQVFFERTLASARISGDRSREANTLLDLSWSADEQTHYDEALDWANAARGIAIPNGFARVGETALGNMGWAYYKLGDPEKAESMFVEARKQAEKLGDISDQVSWLTDAGYIYMDAA